jgi:hypothetical protein
MQFLSALEFISIFRQAGNSCWNKFFTTPDQKNTNFHSFKTLACAEQPYLRLTLNHQWMTLFMPVKKPHIMTVRGSKPNGGEIFCIRPDRLWGPPSPLYSGYGVSFPGVKQPGHGVDHPPPSSAEVKERVELYLYCGPTWPVIGWNLPLHIMTRSVRRPLSEVSYLNWLTYCMLYRIYAFTVLLRPIPVAARSKSWVCGRALAGIVGSNPTRAWLFVSCKVFVLWGRGLCVGLITRPEDSYRLWCVSECDQVKINNLNTCCE